VAAGQTERAARLLGADEALREAHTIPIWPDAGELCDRLVVTARAALGDETFAAAWAAGRILSLEQAIAEALSLGQ
jgi:hypothetical protein